MAQQIELTYDELFLLEIAIDEVLWKLEENSPSYQKFRELNELLYAQRMSFNKKEKKKYKHQVKVLRGGAE